MKILVENNSSHSAKNIYVSPLLLRNSGEISLQSNPF